MTIKKTTHLYVTFCLIFSNIQIDFSNVSVPPKGSRNEYSNGNTHDTKQHQGNKICIQIFSL